MPTALPERFRPEVRLGREGDTEAWLATDTALDRPVLVRSLGPDTTPQRRERFVAAVRAAAGVDHVHLAAVYAVGGTDQGAYAVSEWAGGVTIGDRLRASEPIPVEDFLPNAAGLADALAALHGLGLGHGAVGPDTILFSAAHPAKLDRFGREDNGLSADDTVALAETLTMGLSGGPTDLPLSETVEGLPPAVDSALSSARRGSIDAAGLAAALRAAPSVKKRPPPRGWTWRWLLPAVALIAIAFGVVGLGFALDLPSDSPFLFPTRPPVRPTTTVAPTTTVIENEEEPVDEAVSAPLAVVAVNTHDPFGDGSEHDRDAELAADSDAATAWRTERYFDQLPLLKPGVGLTFDVQGTPGRVEVVASEGLRFELLWAEETPSDFSDWQAVGSGSIAGGVSQLAPTNTAEGTWLLWLTDLPAQEGGEFFYAFVNEVRFLP